MPQHRRGGGPTGGSARLHYRCGGRDRAVVQLEGVLLQLLLRVLPAAALLLQVLLQALQLPRRPDVFFSN